LESNLGSFLKNNPLDPVLRYCISNSVTGCQQKSELFDNPEGVAVFHGSAWVSLSSICGKPM
jgi:hypothetical protein